MAIVPLTVVGIVVSLLTVIILDSFRQLGYRLSIHSVLPMTLQHWKLRCKMAMYNPTWVRLELSALALDIYHDVPYGPKGYLGRTMDMTTYLLGLEQQDPTLMDVTMATSTPTNDGTFDDNNHNATMQLVMEDSSTAMASKGPLSILRPRSWTFAEVEMVMHMPSGGPLLSWKLLRSVLTTPRSIPLTTVGALHVSGKRFPLTVPIQCSNRLDLWKWQVEGGHCGCVGIPRGGWTNLTEVLDALPVAGR
eukprot:Nitzschia sp. Nitz4//scaffold147_size54853//37684//38430//NITZ4_006623-RA/size54853-processed-gene-0.58-mRNA-1//-1//CDS//3329536711//119//frame0